MYFFCFLLLFISVIQKYRITMKKNKEKAISLRLPQELYQKLVNKTIKNSQKEGRLITISEEIRKILEEGI